MGDLVDSSWRPLPQWWVYKRYGDMTGLRTSITPGSEIDGVVFQDSEAHKAMILLGNKGGVTGTVAVRINNIPSWLAADGEVQVLQEWIGEGSSYMNEPNVVYDNGVAVSSNSITFNINWTGSNDAHCLTLTSGLSSSTPTPTNSPSNLGDVNDDGAIDIMDALVLAQYYVGLNPANFNGDNADTNCDGSTDIVDALLIAQYYVGLITEFC